MNAFSLIGPIVMVAIFLWLVVSFPLRAWRSGGKNASLDRWALITSFFTAVSAFALASLLVNWVIVPAAVWLLAVGLLAGGVVVTVMRWPDLPWFAEGVNQRKRAFHVAADLIISVLLIGVVFV
ncbi:MAG TPA: hypothetical protein VIL85_19835 [Thermomicrobiales bacterium]|jgi:hypothetical protein